MRIASFYDSGLLALLGDAIQGKEPLVDFRQDTIRLALTTAEYQPAPEHCHYSDITHEVTGAGYEAGGAPLNGKFISFNGVTGCLEFCAEDTEWSPVDFVAARGVLYADLGTPETSLLLAYFNFPEPTRADAQRPLVLAWPDNVVLSVAIDTAEPSYE